MTGGDAVAESLIQHGVEKIFGLPGAQLYGLFDAFARRADKLAVITARHEQTCGYMALGYAKTAARPGVYAVVPGPGVLNTTASLATAYGGNAPVLCLTGQVPSAFLGRGRGHLHELPDQLATLRLLTKRAERIEHPAEAPATIASVFQTMLSGRRGPAAIEAPWDFFSATAEVLPQQPLPPWSPPQPDPRQIENAAALLADAAAPMIMVGGGALDAGDAVRELAELVEAPVVAFRSGRGIVGDEHDLGTSVAAAYKLWPETDVLLGIGTRLEVPCWRWSYMPDGLKIVRIDIDPAEMRRFAPHVPIVADAREGAAALAAELRRRGVRSKRRRARIVEAKREAAHEIEKVQPQMAFLKAIRDVLPRDGIFAEELSLVGFTSIFGFPIYSPRTFLTSGYQGTLGSGFPMALGAKVAAPERAVVSVTGDGGFMFAAQELATAVQYGIAVVTIVFNNNAFGNVRRDQQNLFDGRVIGADLVNPDFVKLAESFGVSAERARTPEELRVSLERAFAADEPYLIEVPIERGSEVSPWEFLQPPPPKRR